MKHHIKFASTGGLRYPWNEMSRGDFFDVPVCIIDRSKLQSCACHRAERYKGERYETSELFNEHRQKITRVRRVK